MKIKNTGQCTVLAVVMGTPGVWEFGVRFGYGRGRSFNTYTRYYLRQHSNKPQFQKSLWEGWPTGAPDPMNASERRRVVDWIELNERPRRWLERKIITLAAKDGAA